MHTTDNVAIARRYYDAFNARDMSAAVALADAELEWINLAFGATFRGAEGFRQFLENYATAFPDSRVEVRSVIAHGDRVAVEFTAQGTHRGPLVGPAGEIPATGRSVQLQLCEVLQLRDGKIVRGRSYYDSGTMLRQLGLGTAG
jgi:steroid delta-isomerase-like uncharacterized protein